MSRRAIIALLALAAALSGCSSDKSREVSPGTSGGSVTAPATESTAADTTAAPTTGAPTTAPPTTAAPAGWTPILRDDIDGHTAWPCCADTFYGVPSPELPGPGGTLADGDYPIAAEWSDTDPAAPLVVTVHRFEQCLTHPDLSICAFSGGPFDEHPEAMGVDESTSYEFTLPLDGSLRVVLTGFNGWDATTHSAVGSGADLAALAVALDTAYWSAIGSRVAAGEDAWDVQQDVHDHPTGGFVPGGDGSDTTIAFVDGSAPPVLMQGLMRYEGDTAVAGAGTDWLGLVSLHVEGGQLTLFVYAGFYS